MLLQCTICVKLFVLLDSIFLYVCFIDTFTMCNRKQKFRLHTQTSIVSAYIISNLFSCVSCFVVSDVKNKLLIALLFVERLLAAVYDRLRVVCVFACLLFFGEGCFIFCVSFYGFKGISFVNMLYESPRRKPGWRFTAGFEFQINVEESFFFRKFKNNNNNKKFHFFYCVKKNTSVDKTRRTFLK